MIDSLKEMRQWLNSEEATETDRSQLQTWCIAIATHPLLLPCLHSLSYWFDPSHISRLSNSTRLALQSYSCSGKFLALKLLIEKALSIGKYEDTEERSPVSKVILFSQHPKVLKLIESQLLTRYSNLRYVTLVSTMSNEQRMKAVESFQLDNSVRLLLATTGVCGHGVTLTAAQTVILVDHNYNPYVDLQAIDRSHRIGQNSTLQVYRLVSNEPNESRVMCLQRFKEHVATEVIKMDHQHVEEMAVMREVLGPKKKEKRKQEEKCSAEKRKRVEMGDSGCDGYEIYE